MASKSSISQKRFEQYLLQLTNLPTAAGKEQRVVDWVLGWASRKRSIKIRRDKFGNILLARKNSAISKNAIIFAAHIDHPAFVVTNVQGEKVTADFRGGVDSAYFKNAKVCLRSADGKTHKGIVQSTKQPGAGREYKQAIIKFGAGIKANSGDIITWDLPASKIKSGKLYAPVCDNLAGVAAALSAFEQYGKTKRKHDVHVLLTRGEEVGFIGAIAACKSKLIGQNSRIIVLENSRSFANSPIGAGPIIRVGDSTSTFDPQLTFTITQIAKTLVQSSKSNFNFQRKLMPGGTCEATAYQALGHKAACICLPLGNYHNQHAQPQFPQSADSKTAPVKIDREIISTSDYHNLIKLLVETAKKIDDPKQKPDLRKRLEQLFQTRKNILD